MILLLAAQTIAFAILVARLLPGRTRRPPVQPLVAESDETTVSVIVATLNEAGRIAPCLAGLMAQRHPLREILVVDSRSTDGTRELVQDAARRDARIRLLTDDPLPAGWVGKPWALQHGLNHARSEWVLGIDADVEPNPGLVNGAVRAARGGDYALVSFAPMFAEQTAAERLLQPALLRTLIFRGGAAGADTNPERVLANGQCFLARRDALLRHGGYAVARDSFADDVTVARHLARRGERVGFLDGSRLFRVRSYRGAAEMWREWGRSIDLRNATPSRRQWFDVVYLALVQGIPLPVVVTLGMRAAAHGLSTPGWGLLALNAGLLVVSALLLAATADSYERRGPAYWCSWIADPLAVFRILLSTIDRRRSWRGREYGRMRPTSGMLTCQNQSY